MRPSYEARSYTASIGTIPAALKQQSHTVAACGRRFASAKTGTPSPVPCRCLGPNPGKARANVRRPVTRRSFVYARVDVGVLALVPYERLGSLLGGKVIAERQKPMTSIDQEYSTIAFGQFGAINGMTGQGKVRERGWRFALQPSLSPSMDRHTATSGTRCPFGRPQNSR